MADRWGTNQRVWSPGRCRGRGAPASIGRGGFTPDRVRSIPPGPLPRSRGKTLAHDAAHKGGLCATFRCPLDCARIHAAPACPSGGGAARRRPALVDARRHPRPACGRTGNSGGRFDHRCPHASTSSHRHRHQRRRGDGHRYQPDRAVEWGSGRDRLGPRSWRQRRRRRCQRYLPTGSHWAVAEDRLPAGPFGRRRPLVGADGDHWQPGGRATGNHRADPWRRCSGHHHPGAAPKHRRSGGQDPGRG